MSARWSGSPEQRALTLGGVDRLDFPSGRPGAFLDRDGTLNEAIPDPDSGMPESPLTRDGVRLISGAAAAARDLAEAGYALVCVTNQPAAAKGKTTLRQLLDVHERVLELLAREGVRLELSLLCPHHPESRVRELSGLCACRKPAPGMLITAAVELDLDLGASWMLGDTDADVGAGRAGCRTALIEYPPSVHKRSGEAHADISAPDVAGVVAQLLQGRGG